MNSFSLCKSFLKSTWEGQGQCNGVNGHLTKLSTLLTLLTPPLPHRSRALSRIVYLSCRVLLALILYTAVEKATLFATAYILQINIRKNIIGHALSQGTTVKRSAAP